jgi:hypothetical protein
MNVCFFSFEFRDILLDSIFSAHAQFNAEGRTEKEAKVNAAREALVAVFNMDRAELDRMQTDVVKQGPLERTAMSVLTSVLQKHTKGEKVGFINNFLAENVPFSRRSPSTRFSSKVTTINRNGKCPLHSADVRGMSSRCRQKMAKMCWLI